MKANPFISKKTVSFLCVGVLFLTVISSSAWAADTSTTYSANIGGSEAAGPKLEADPKSAWETRSFKAAIYSAIFVMFAGFCAGAWAVVVWRRELRWKQAELARQLMDDIFDFAPSENAWDMVDGYTEFKDKNDQKIEISDADVRRALELIVVDGKKELRDGRSEKERREERFIRDCFDALFYYIERLERSLRIKVVHFDDLVAPSGYYINLMATKKMLFKEYAQFIGFDDAIAFMDRFPEWRDNKA